MYDTATSLLKEVIAQRWTQTLKYKRYTDNLGEKGGHGNVITSKEIGEVFLEEETLELRSESRMMKTEIQPRGRKGKVF